MKKEPFYRDTTLTRNHTLSRDDLCLLAHGAKLGRKGERDYLLVMTLTLLDVHEAIFLRLESISVLENQKTTLDVIGKGGKLRTVYCPAKLAEKLGSYAQRANLSPSDRFFPFNRQRCWQIVKEAAARTNLNNGLSPRLLRGVKWEQISGSSGGLQ